MDNFTDLYKTNTITKDEIINSKILENVKEIHKSIDEFSHTRSNKRKKELIDTISEEIHTAYHVIADVFTEVKAVNKTEAFSIAIKDFILLSKLLVTKGKAFIKNADFINEKILKLYESYIDYILLLLTVNKEEKLIKFNNIVLLVINDLTELGLFFISLGSDFIKELTVTREIAENFIKECIEKMYVAEIDEAERARMEHKFGVSFGYMIEEWYKVVKKDKTNLEAWIKYKI